MLAEIKQEAQALAEKQTWLRKGFQDLLDKMNAEVAPIVGDFRVRGTLYEEEPDVYTGIQILYVLLLDGEYDANFSVQKRIDRWDPRYEDVDIKSVAVGVLRGCVAGIPAALDELLGKLKEKNGEYQSAIDSLSEMIAKLA